MSGWKAEKYLQGRTGGRVAPIGSDEGVMIKPPIKANKNHV